MERGFFGSEQGDMQTESIDTSADITASTDLCELPDDILEDTPAEPLKQPDVDNDDLPDDIPEDAAAEPIKQPDVGDNKLPENIPEDTAPETHKQPDLNVNEHPDAVSEDIATKDSVDTEDKGISEAKSEMKEFPDDRSTDTSNKGKGLPEAVGYLEKEPLSGKETKSDQDIYKTVNEALKGASKEEKDYYKSLPLEEGTTGDHPSLKRTDLDPYAENEDEKSNMEITQEGDPPIVDNKKIELHHIKQKPDSPFAELTTQEHRGKGNDRMLHDKTKPTDIDRNEFAKERQHHWKVRSQEMIEKEIKKIKNP
jgi:hypothetical protein